MNPQIVNSIDYLQLPKPFFFTQFPHSSLPQRIFTTRFPRNNPRNCKLRTAASNSLSVSETSSSNEEDAESAQLLEKLKESERKRVNELEELERKACVQLDRQLVLASSWNRALLRVRGKLKGTEWDPEDSHRIDFSDFLKLLDSNNVQFIEYSDYGQKLSVILPHYKNGKASGIEGNPKDIVFRRHAVDRMPIDCWNDVWGKLHQQIVNVDVINVDALPAEVYTTMATAVVWSMRLALAVGFYVWIDNRMRPIYSKLIPCDLGTPSTPQTKLPVLRRHALGSIGKSRAKFISAEERTGVTFDDFAGQEYIKRELQEIVRILKNDEEFQDKGIYCPKGVLLHGPPGTGKTLLAKAIAGEAGLPFFAASGTDFVEMFSGVAASRVKDLFASARSFAPSIIFIDEIDAIGSKRGGPDIGGGGAEREQGLLQILTEMDGFKVSTAQVLVIGATNRLDIIDPALLRKGRFDKIIRVGLPLRDGRLAILKVHAMNKYFRSEEEKDTLLNEIAELTEDFTGAELQNILNEAGILTARKDLDYIGRDELLEALKRQKGTFETGQEDTTEIPEELRLRLAYREAAVAVIACYFPEPLRPFVELAFELLKEGLLKVKSNVEPLVENIHVDGIKTVAAAAAVESGNGLTELKWQKIERSAVCPSPSEATPFNDVPTLSSKIGVPVEVSKENDDFRNDEEGLTSEQGPTVDSEEHINSGNKLIASEGGLESSLVSSDIGQQNLNSLDLGDAYKLAVGNRGRQLSGMLAEHWLWKDSSRVNEDLKILMSQFSATRGTDMSFNDISPRLSINSEEAKSSDVSNSTGMQILQKMISLERNESGLSLDGSIVGEIEGESPVDKLKRQVDHDRKLMNALYKELEEERNASAIAASQALAMITRLQEEKATLHMEALQHLRMMDEQSEYEMEALQNANDLLAEKEKEIEDLEAKVEFYRNNFPNEMLLENTVEKNSEMKVKDIGLDHSQCTFVENNESVPEKSVAENPNIYDKTDILLTSAKEKNIQSVKSSIMEFQDEKLYISQRLKKLEKQVYFFLNTHHSQDNLPYSENVGNEYPENSEKLDNNLLTEDSLLSFKLNSDATIDDPSSKKLPVCKQNGETEYSGGCSPVLCENNDLASTRSVVSDFMERLQALEADHSFLEHTISLLSEGGEGIKLLHEIADRLQQLRKIGIRERDHPVA